MDIYVVWGQYCDKSNDPVFIEAFRCDLNANVFVDKLNKLQPTMNVYVTKVWLEKEINGLQSQATNRS